MVLAVNPITNITNDTAELPKFLFELKYFDELFCSF